MKSFSQQAGIQGGLGAAFPSHATFPHYAIPQGLPYHVYGYSLSLSLHIQTHVVRSRDPMKLESSERGRIQCITCMHDVHCNMPPWSMVNGHVSNLFCVPILSISHCHTQA